MNRTTFTFANSNTPSKNMCVFGWWWSLRMLPKVGAQHLTGTGRARLIISHVRMNQQQQNGITVNPFFERTLVTKNFKSPKFVGIAAWDSCFYRCVFFSLSGICFVFSFQLCFVLMDVLITVNCAFQSNIFWMNLSFNILFISKNNNGARMKNAGMKIY